MNIRVYSGTSMNNFCRGYDPKTQIFDKTKISESKFRKLFVDIFFEKDIDKDWIDQARSSAKRIASKTKDKAIIFSGLIDKKILIKANYGYTIGTFLKIDRLYLFPQNARIRIYDKGLKGLIDISDKLSDINKIFKKITVPEMFYQHLSYNRQ